MLSVRMLRHPRAVDHPTGRIVKAFTKISNRHQSVVGRKMINFKHG